jgi:serine/threonine-protein kinase
VSETKLPPHLIVLSGEHKGDVIVLDDGLPVVFGTRAGISFPEAELDPVHCQILNVDGRWFLQDFGSEAGTWLGDDRVEGIRPLEFGRSFRIGGTHLAVMLPDHDGAERFMKEIEGALRGPADLRAEVDVEEDDDGGEIAIEDETTDLIELPDLSALTAAVEEESSPGAKTDVIEVETPPAAEDAPTSRSGVLRVQDSLGDYDIVEVLGEGSLGQVYKGYDRKRRRLVAIKVLDAKLAKNDRSVARFLRGAKAGGRLSHRHIVRVLAAGHAHGRIYVTMEFVEGLNLEQFCAASGGKLMPMVALGIVNRIGDALIYAHGRGVIHRNVPPRNILVGAGGVPKLSDLALAKRAAAPRKTDMQITAQGQILARSLYTPPEGLLGDKMDERSDVYGLGATLFRALCGVPPYGSDRKKLTQRAMTRDLEEVARLAPSLSKPLVTLLERCLDPDPKARFQKMRDMRDAIADLPETGV